MTTCCIDCGRDTQPILPGGLPDRSGWDFYMVRGAVWAAAGMTGWHGHLCTPCLERRLGRRLADADYLAKVTGWTDEGMPVFGASADYARWVMAGELPADFPQ